EVHRPEALLDLLDLGADAWQVEEPRVTVGCIHLREEHAMPLLAEQQRERAGDGALAHATLAGDEMELPIQRHDARSSSALGTASRARRWTRSPACPIPGSDTCSAQGRWQVSRG